MQIYSNVLGHFARRPYCVFCCALVVVFFWCGVWATTNRAAYAEREDIDGLTLLGSMDTLRFDTYNNGVRSIGSNIVLNSGIVYSMTISGTYNRWFSNLWSATCSNSGVPEDAPEIPSPGVVNGLVGLDAAYTFAYPDAYSNCTNLPIAPFSTPAFSFSLDNGLSWITPSPVTDSYNSQHVYNYTLIGKGHRLLVKQTDDRVDDNYGVLTIFLAEQEVARTNISLPIIQVPMSHSTLSWPFDTNDGEWSIINGYRGAIDHSPGGSPNDYALLAFDFAKCGKIDAVNNTCDLAAGWARTTDSTVLSPVSGTIVWTDSKCAGISLEVDGMPGYRVALFHIEGYPASGHVTQGHPIGTVSDRACIGSGDHIHMVLYYQSALPSDLVDMRERMPFSGEWNLGGCSYPDDRTTRQQYLGQLIPCFGKK